MGSRAMVRKQSMAVLSSSSSSSPLFVAGPKIRHSSLLILPPAMHLLPAIAASASPSLLPIRWRRSLWRQGGGAFAPLLLPIIASSSSSSSSSSPSSSSKNMEPLPSKEVAIDGARLLDRSNGAVSTSLVELQSDAGFTWIQKAEAGVERMIFDCRFLALFAVVGSLAGSFICFLKGCVYISESYEAFFAMCRHGVHTGQMVLRLVEAVDVYLSGTVMLIFGMGLYGLFISNVPNNLEPSNDRALRNSSFFGMFTLQERPRWMRISSLDELKTKLGHAIVMILLVKMFEKSKAIPISNATELLMYSVSILLSSASLFVLHKLHH